MTLPELMIRYRAEHNLTQEKAAEIAGVGIVTWRTAEKGEQTAKLTEAKIRLAMERRETVESINNTD